MLDKCRYCALCSTWKPSYDRYLLNDDRYKPSVFEMIDSAAKVGLDGIELIHPQQVNHNNLDAIKAALEDANMLTAAIAVSVSSKRQYRGGSLTADEPGTRREAIETVKTGMDIAAELNTGVVNLWLGRDGFDYPFQIDYDQSWNRLINAFKEIGEHRSEIKVAIVYKTKEPRNWLLTSTAAKTALLANEVGLPNIGALIDFGHTMVSNESPAESVALLARNNILFHTHLNDNTRLWDDDMAFGSLHFLETFEFLYWLDRVGYEGWLSFDPHAQLEDPSKMVEECFRYTKGMISMMERIGNEAIESAIATRQVTEIMALLRKEIFE